MSTQARTTEERLAEMEARVKALGETSPMKEFSPFAVSFLLKLLKECKCRR